MSNGKLLLVLLGIIVACVGVVVGTIMLVNMASDKNRESVQNDLINLATRARQHLHRPLALGGGHGAFDGSNGGPAITATTDLTSKPTNQNGTYHLGIIKADEILIVGTGTATGRDGKTPIMYDIRVWADSTSVEEIN